MTAVRVLFTHKKEGRVVAQFETPLVRHSEAPHFHQRREESREGYQTLHARSLRHSAQCRLFAPPEKRLRSG